MIYFACTYCARCALVIYLYVVRHVGGFPFFSGRRKIVVNRRMQGHEVFFLESRECARHRGLFVDVTRPIEYLQSIRVVRSFESLGLIYRDWGVSHSIVHG